MSTYTANGSGAARHARRRPVHEIARGESRATGSRASVLEWVLIAAVACMLVAAAVGATFRTPATTRPLSTTTVRVEQNQTLWDIARHHRLDGATTAQTVQQIRVINGLDTSAVAVGQILEVPADHASVAFAAR